MGLGHREDGEMEWWSDSFGKVVCSQGEKEYKEKRSVFTRKNILFFDRVRSLSKMGSKR